MNFGNIARRRCCNDVLVNVMFATVAAGANIPPRDFMDDKNSEDILNNYTELKEESKIIDVKVNKNTEDIKNISPLWYSMEDLLN